MEKKNTRFSLALRGGSYSLTVTAVVAAILVVVNIFVSLLPISSTKLDISADQLYSVTSNTKAVLNALQQDVTIYWMVQSDMEDTIIENLLGKYESLSSHVTVVKKNPDVYPTFAAQYTEEEVSNNSLIVVSELRSRYISYDSIYLTESDYYYTYTTAFDGEGVITSAIDYVVTQELPKLYLLEGHGESALPATFADAVAKANIETEQLSLLTVDTVPEDADCLLIYGPQSDISQQERTMLAEYTAAGGKLLVMAGPLEDATLTNLYNLLYDYGVYENTGFVIEGSRDHYAMGYPYLLMPDLVSSPITDPLIEESYSPIVFLAQGLDTSFADTESVTVLMQTSESAYSKVDGFALETYDKEDDDVAGPFALAVSVETAEQGQIVWFSGTDFLDEDYNSYSSGANVDLVMNSLSALIGEQETISIRSKSLSYNYLTISESAASAVRLLLIGLCPLMYLGFGVYMILRKRGMQNEAS